ncbi:MAG: hypothetical protein L0Z55_03265 [Planctomycetes bacterium]|nr:hypothetical protein [Planctomycetota bacterium]
MSFPYDDWQFYVVTAVCAFGAWVVVKPFLPSRKSKRHGCGGCNAGGGGGARNAAAATSIPERDGPRR